MCKEIWKKENIVTLLEIFIFTIGLKFCFDEKIFYSIICLIFLGICDGFDGKLAQKFRKKSANKEYGIQLDSLADIISSAVFPVIICYSMGFNNIIDLVVYSIFIICGVTRLAYYNVNSSKKDIKYFQGVPITVSTMIIPVIYIIVDKEIAYIMALSILSILYVSNIKIKKPKMGLKISLSIIGIIISIFILLKGYLVK